MAEALEESTNWWAQELALVEGAALRIEGLEAVARGAFVRHRESLGPEGGAALLRSHELATWLQARRDTDAAWGRWYEVMVARPPEG
ncbi:MULTISPECIES: hypothetical protein [Ramlibacter]|uniref:Uncharacterized protein n=1 Tax=Ramlibacter aquaticus TaxID=2780094 RepID=A0ABR9SAA5_9BURK|nr:MULTISPECIES: hypothetical protein [Ramlibacter]MBE7939230.1 hypothetical protein [Ramlibacter aquaticus]